MTVTNEHYIIDDKPRLRVTKLLAKHGLATDYSQVDPIVLQNKAQYGTDIHKDIEDYLLGNKNYQNLYEISKTAIDLLKDYTILESEKRVYNDIVAGTLDILAIKDNDLYVMDVKTTYNLNITSVSWQLSIYAYLLGLDIKGITAIWLDKSKDSFVLVDLPMVSKDNIELLLDCELKGLNYKEMSIISTQDMEVMYQVFADYDRQEKLLKELKEQKEAFVEKLKNAMVDNNIKSFDNDYLKITYVAPQTRVSYDYKKYLDDNGIELSPSDLDSIKKETQVKDSVRITIKGEK